MQRPIPADSGSSGNHHLQRELFLYQLDVVPYGEGYGAGIQRAVAGTTSLTVRDRRCSRQDRAWFLRDAIEDTGHQDGLAGTQLMEGTVRHRSGQERKFNFKWVVPPEHFHFRKA